MRRHRSTPVLRGSAPSPAAIVIAKNVADVDTIYPLPDAYQRILSFLLSHDILISMRTRVTDRGQVSIPAAIRRQLRITANTALEWIVEGNALRVVPIPDDPIAALRGSGKRGAVRRLLADRRRDTRRDG